MRIAIIAHGLSDGGAERVASLVANHYVKKHEVLFLAVYSKERIYPLDDAVKYTYVGGQYSGKISRLVGRSRCIDRELKEFKADIAVSFILNESIYSTLRKTVPVIYSLRISPTQACETVRGYIRCLLAFVGAKKIIFQTPDARDFFSGNIRRKGIVIANPLTRGLPVWTADAEAKTVMTACRLNTQKNIPMLISGFAKFHQQYPDYSLKIYGDGPLLEELRAYAKTCGVEDSVFFPGYAKGIHEIMAGSGIFALTSDFEGLSNSMLEALAIGIPTVCTDCPPGGAAAYIEDGVNGMLIPVGDAEELAKRLCRMAADRELCLRMSANSQKIREILDVDKVLQQWEAALE